MIPQTTAVADVPDLSDYAAGLYDCLMEHWAVLPRRPMQGGEACSPYATRDHVSGSRLRAVRFHDDPTNDCGSGSHSLTFPLGGRVAATLRTSQSGRGGGGGQRSIRRGGFWDPKVCVPKRARSVFPFVNFFSSHDGHFGLGVGVSGCGGGGGGVHPRCTAIQMCVGGEHVLVLVEPPPPSAPLPSPRCKRRDLCRRQRQHLRQLTDAQRLQVRGLARLQVHGASPEPRQSGGRGGGEQGLGVADEADGVGLGGGGGELCEQLVGGHAGGDGDPQMCLHLGPDLEGVGVGGGEGACAGAQDGVWYESQG